ncbi:MAG: serine/threonine-protein kinase [Acidobacteriota bacterium]
MARTDEQSIRGKQAIRADRVFVAALDLVPAERKAFVARECAGEPEVLALVERLLANVEGDTDLPTGGGMAGPLWDGLAENLTAEPDLGGTVVDRYRIVRELGRGGMAVVYLAERADSQFDHQVALKLIKRGTDTDEVVRRFRQERQIMALTQHPNIARLLDGGSTPEGRPYFVMEHVAGQPIDRYCDEARLTIRQRLRLFLEVARAVDHAHRNLVVHRDIKPSNILVSEDGEVKLLDFGIAKFLDPAAQVQLTRSQMRMLTPAYASPEQVRGIPVSTASDIYQLGLLLYLLITGQSPYRAGSSTSQDLAQAITEEPPTRPSTVIRDARSRKTSPAERSSQEAVFRQRRTTPIRLQRDLDGDLDNIVLMALRKEPERRYASTQHLIDDIERHLAGRPILARPNTWRYRCSKFVRRHALAVAASAVMVLVIAGLIAFYTWQLKIERDRASQAAERASREAVVANQVSSFLVGLFEVSDPNQAQGEVVTAREILDRGAERITAEVQEDPSIQARLMKTMGRVYRNLGLFDSATSLLEGALEVQAANSGSEPLAVADSLSELGDLFRQLGRFDEAESHLERALQLIEDLESPEKQAELIDKLAQLKMEQGRLLEAEGLFRRSLAVLEAHRGPEDIGVAEVLNNLALVLRYDSRAAEAVPLFQRALPIMERSLGTEHTDVAITLSNLALAHRDQGQYAAAAPLYLRALAILEKLLGPEHPQVAIVLHNYADLLSNQAAFDAAEPLYHRSRAILEVALGPEHPNVATSLHSLGDLYLARGDFDRAEATHRKSLAIREKILGPDHPLVGQALIGHAKALRQLGRVRQAEGLEERAAAIRARRGSL